MKVNEVLEKIKSGEINFPFEDEINTAVLVCNHILDNNEPILYVSHDKEDGMWQFLCGESHEEADATIVSLYSIYNHDESIGELATMPVGYFAERKNTNEQWVIYKSE